MALAIDRGRGETLTKSDSTRYVAFAYVSKRGQSLRQLFTCTIAFPGGNLL
jgi:hypothetical protein